MGGMTTVMSARPEFGKLVWNYLKFWMHGPVYFGEEQPEESLRYMGWV